jgi:hypothetical protein
MNLKIVIVALVAAIVVTVAGINARVTDVGSLAATAKTSGTVVKAGKPAFYSTGDDAA